MATKTTAAGLIGVDRRIYEAAYVQMYEATVLDKLCKAVGVGKKGISVQWPFVNPTTWATAASALTTGNDFVNYTALTSATKQVVASELGITTWIEDPALEDDSAGLNPVQVTAEMHALAIAAKLEKHIASKFTGFTEGTVTATTSSGLTFNDVALGKATLDSRQLTVPKPYDLVTNGMGNYYLARSQYTTTYASALGAPGDEILRKFYVNTYFGDVRHIICNYVANVTASSLATGAMFGDKSAIGLWTPREFRLEKQRDVSARAEEMVSTKRVGAGVLVPGYGVMIKFRDV